MTEQPDQLRAFTRRLFNRPDGPAIEALPEAQPHGNVVPHEGTNPQTPQPRSDLRGLTRQLFGRHQ